MDNARDHRVAEASVKFRSKRGLQFAKQIPAKTDHQNPRRTRLRCIDLFGDLRRCEMQCCRKGRQWMENVSPFDAFSGAVRFESSTILGDWPFSRWEIGRWQQCIDIATASSPRETEHGPSTNEHGPSTNEHGPSTNEHGPSTNEHGPSTNEHGPSATLRGPSATEPGQTATDHGPSATESRPSATDHGPSATESGSKRAMKANRRTAVFTEPGRQTLLQFPHASRASRATHCYTACFVGLTILQYLALL